jgi:hypothetical protein
MADGHDLLNSPKYKKLSFESIDINSINLLKDQADLVYHGKRVIWCRDFRSLQNFVENVIELSGTWRSSGGKSKQFMHQLKFEFYYDLVSWQAKFAYI